MQIMLLLILHVTLNAFLKCYSEKLNYYICIKLVQKNNINVVYTVFYKRIGKFISYGSIQLIM